MLRIVAIAFLTLIPRTLLGADNPHFYRATYFYGEPRLAKPFLSSWDITVGWGSTTQSRNSLGKKTCLLNIYGNENLQVLGEGVPCKSSNDPVDIALINIARLPARSTFGHLIFQGKFTIAEANIFFTNNFCNGFFMQAHVPIRNIEITNIACKDLSPADNVFPNINTPAWQTLLHLFPQVLQKYNLSLAPIHHKGIGDASLLFGWTRNYQETEVLDFIDTTFKIGVLFPTGSEKNQALAFDIPLGYGGFYGIPLSVDASFGCYEWLTIGMHLGALPFFNAMKNWRINTNINQTGFIQLTQTCVCVQPGTLFEAGGFIKADHMCRGLSLLAAFSYARKQADGISPRAVDLFDQQAICADQRYHGWNMSTLNFLAEYDFAQEQCRFGPRVGIFYNLVVGGKRIFNTNMVGGSFGLDIALQF